MAEGVLFGIAGEVKNKLVSLAAAEFALWWGFKKELGNLDGTVERIKDVLIDAEKRARIEQTEQLEKWIWRLREAVFDAEDLLDDFSAEVERKKLVPRYGLCEEVRIFFSASNQIWYGLRMAHKVRSLRERLEAIKKDSEDYHFEVQKKENVPLTMVREQTTSFEPEIVIGRDDDKRKVVNFLLNPNYEQNVSAICIVGMGGLGKTTLAQHVFNDEQVKVHFGLKLWVSVSGSFDVTKIVKDILEAIAKKDRIKEPAGSMGVSDGLESVKSDRLESLGAILAEKVDNRKYLLVLDDVWEGKQDDGEKWDGFKKLLPRDVKGSKVVLTTRSLKIAKFTVPIAPHVLQGLSVDASWDLFRRKAFTEDLESHHVVDRIREEIVERCHGVPLVIKAIAGLMCGMDKSQWLSFIINDLPDRVHDDNIIQTLKLSYDLLPSNEKHCFSYCSLFPKGQDISVKSLIRLWIAQGFISPSNPNLEATGRSYFRNLLDRSFFHEVKRDQLGNDESCKMHDLATKVAASESIKVDRERKSDSEFTRHLSSEIELDFSQPIPNLLPSAKRLRTLMLFGGKWNEGAWESICSDCRCLRVLNLHSLGIKEVSPRIKNFKLLKYLDLSDNHDMEALPNSITDLVNLQVLKLNECWELKALPKDINKLTNLKHLDLGCAKDDDFCNSLEHMPRGIGQLTSLQTLSCFVVAKNSSDSKDIGGLNELKSLNGLTGCLEIRVRGYETNSCISEFKEAKLIEKQNLRSLTILLYPSDGGSQSDTGSYGEMLDPDLELHEEVLDDSAIELHEEMLESLQPHSKLEELFVGGYGGMRLPCWLSELSNLIRIGLFDCRSCKHIPPLHGIPCLEELSIDDFPKLEYIDNEGVGGRGASMFFPSLKELEVVDCPKLKGWCKKSDRTPAEEELMLHFPCLSILAIEDCPDLTSMPLFPSVDDVVNFYSASSAPLQQTMKMTAWKSPSLSSFIRPLSKLKKLQIHDAADMEFLPEDGLQNLSSLQELQIKSCPRLKCLPLSGGMHSLQKLEISLCPQLTSLSQSHAMPQLLSLQELNIAFCTEELSGRLRSKDAVDWPNIAHIPEILIDDRSIQRDGQYIGSE